MNHPWTGSYLPLYKTDWIQAPVQDAPDLVMVYFLLGLALLVFIMYGRVILAISSSLSIFRSNMRIREVLRDKYRMESILTVLILVLPFFALSFTASGISTHNYWMTLAIILIFFAGRYLLLKMTAWLTGKRDELNKVNKLSMAVFLLVSVLSTLIPVVLKIMPTVPRIAVITYLVAMSSVLLLFYFAKERAIFLDSGFSHFFWILYLCTLEILPICMAVNAIAF